MKKKIASLSMAVVLAFGLLAMNVFAASPQGGIAVSTGGSTVPANTTLVATSAPEAKEIAEAKRVSLGIAGNIVAVFNISLRDAANQPIAPDANTVIRVDISGLTTHDRVRIVHIMDDGTYEEIVAISHDGFATFKPTSFSLFAVAVEKVNAPDGGTTPESPKTGVYA